jgi:hypothetical protein
LTEAAAVTTTLEPHIEPRLRRPQAAAGEPRSGPPSDLDAEIDWHRAAVHPEPAGKDGLVDTSLPIDPSHYALLNLPEGAPAEDVARAIGRLGLEGPVVPGGALRADARRAELQLAAAVLSDAARRHVYDQWLQRERRLRAQLQARAAAKSGRWGRWVRRWWIWLPLLALLLWSVGRGG